MEDASRTGPKTEKVPPTHNDADTDVSAPKMARPPMLTRLVPTELPLTDKQLPRLADALRETVERREAGPAITAEEPILH